MKSGDEKKGLPDDILKVNKAKLSLDITDRKQVEKALRESVQKFEAAFEGSHDAITIVTEEGEFVDCNQRALEMFGISSKEEFRHNRPASFSPPFQPDGRSSVEVSRELISQTIVKGFNRFEWLHQRKNGETFPAEVIHTLYRIGEKVVLQSNVRDITERKQVEETLKYQFEFEKVVSEISHTFVNLPSGELDQGVNHALQLTGTFFNVDRSYLVKYSADGTKMSITHEWCAENIESQLATIQNFPVNNMPWWAGQIENNEYVCISDTNILPPEAKAERKLFKHQDTKSFLCVPMLKGNRVTGFFGFESVKTKKVWAAEQPLFLKVVAETLVNAFEKNLSEQKLADYTLELEQLYHQLDEEINKARHVHERTLPKALPAVEALSFAAHYLPAQKLGGDFYDVIRKDNKLIFYLSDVSGHGLDGAMLSAFIKHTIKNYILFTPTLNIAPAYTLRHLAIQFHQESYPDDLYICIFLAVLDLESMALTYTGAGFQNAPLVQLGDGHRRELTTPGLFITTCLPAEMLQLHEESIILTPGTTIFCSTDGLTEQSNSDGLYYMDRLPEIYYKNAHLPPQLVCQAVEEDFRCFNDDVLQGRDDITILVLQVDPVGKETHHMELASDFSELIRMRKDALNILATDIEEVGTFITSLYELAANAIEHGNRFDPGKTVSVELIITKRYLQATVQDQGEGFNWREKRDKPMELDGNQFRDRGIAMTRICCEHFFYNDKGNSATVVVETNRATPRPE